MNERSAAIAVSRLTKRYGENEAVSGVDLTVHDGEVLAFLGPNGAGKTTTVEILAGLRARTSGDVRVLGTDPADATAEWRERIGVVLQGAKHEGEFTSAEIITMWSAYYRSPRRLAEVLELVGLSEVAETRSRRLSGGQQQRLAVALALVGQPDLIFLDEPTTGFDPAARREAWETISGLRSLGVTVMLTTHYMDEADHLADRIVVISRGQIVADGTAAELASQAAMPTRISWDASQLSIERLPVALRDLLSTEEDSPLAGVPPISTSTPIRAAERLVIATHEVDDVVRQLLSAAEVASARLDSLAVQPPTLEDTYLALTGAEANEVGS